MKITVHYELEHKRFRDFGFETVVVVVVSNVVAFVTDLVQIFNLLDFQDLFTDRRVIWYCCCHHLG